MIKVANEFLDFDEVIEVEKQIKLFEDISTTDGDFSYAFDLPKTLNNKRLLQNPQPDNISKPVYQRIEAKLLSDGGAELYNGYLRVERITTNYECSFFAGNNNWFARITGLLTDLDFSFYDVEQTTENIIASWEATDGIVFPLIDNGGLITRSYQEVKIEDFVGAFYVKTIFNKIFTEAGIKIQGELLEDWRYQNMICESTSKDQSEIDARSSYVEKNVIQVLPFNTLTKVTWDNDSISPFFDGANNCFDLPNSRYVADIKMAASVNYTLQYIGTGFAGFILVYIYINGLEVRVKGANAPEDTLAINSLTFNVALNSGDVLEIYAIQINSDGDAGQILEGNIKITPTYIYKTNGNSAVPNWTSQQFVSNILRAFNVLASFNAGDSTLTLNLFEKLKSKPPIDLSEYISDTEVDYSEFISDYGQNSILSYKQVEFEELKAYNQGKYFKYGQGVIEVDNEFLEESKEILSLDFANPIAYVNAVFDASLEKTNLIELEEGESVTFSDVGNDGLGNAAFRISNDIFLIGDLVRVKDSTNSAYNGDWVVQSTPSPHVTLSGVPFDSAATGTIIKLNYKYSNSEDVFLFIHIPNYAVDKFAGQITFSNESYYPLNILNIGLAYFDIINTGRQINLDFTLSLSFGGIDDPLHYMVTMKDQYFRLFSRVLNDPVKLINVAHLPYAVYQQIDFLSPVTIKVLETQNMYFLNRMSGYKDSFLPVILETIKI